MMVSAEAVGGTAAGGLAALQTASADTIIHPTPAVPQIDAELVKARFVDYMRIVKKKKDIRQGQDQFY